LLNCPNTVSISFASRYDNKNKQRRPEMNQKEMNHKRKVKTFFFFFDFPYICFLSFLILRWWNEFWWRDHTGGIDLPYRQIEIYIYNNNFSIFILGHISAILDTSFLSRNSEKEEEKKTPERIFKQKIRTTNNACGDVCIQWSQSFAIQGFLLQTKSQKSNELSCIDHNQFYLI